MTDNEVARKEDQTQEIAEKDMTQMQRGESDTIYVPNVDILEGEETVKLLADMPGVDQSTLDVTVENNVLTIEGRAQLEAPEGYELVGQEYGVGRYRRDFTLSDSVDADGIKAKVRHGVLELTLPKREEAKTRKIKIES